MIVPNIIDTKAT